MSHALSYDLLPQHHIRLLRFRDAELDQSMAELKIYPLDSCPQYTALSYQWGSPGRDRKLKTAHGVLDITTSLENFIQEVSSRQQRNEPESAWASEWFWIDAICIDQGSTSERNHQVRRMKEIYEQATKVVIWLGPGDDSTEEGFDALEQLAELDSEEASIWEGSMPGVTCRIGQAPSFVEVPMATITYDLGNILRSEYWERVWIIQEASTPLRSKSQRNGDDAATILCCGNNTIAWSTLCKANNILLQASWANEVPEAIPLHGIANDSIATLQYIQDRRMAKSYAESLYTMLVRNRNSECTDSRDKVYALLALTIERHGANLQPDYDLEIEQVYTETATAIIAQTNSLELLGSAGLSRNHDVPSWTPDWTAQQLPQPFYQYERRFNRADGTVSSEKRLYAADNNITATISFSKDGRRMAVTGFYFDSIAAISEPRDYLKETFSPSKQDTLNTLWKNWIALMNPVTTTKNTTCPEDLSKILTADIKDVGGDWSAERGGQIDDFTDTSINPLQVDDSTINSMTWHRRLFRTSQGHLGLCASSIEIGDCVYILFGSQMPIVLRQEAEHWLHVAQAYVHGIMDGEAVGQENRADEEVFEIW